ncbi:vari [Trypoxylus dichotomus]
MVGLRKENRHRRDLLVWLKNMSLRRQIENATAFLQVKNNIDSLEAATNGVNEIDLIFLRGLMDGPFMQTLIKLYFNSSKLFGSFKMTQETEPLYESIHCLRCTYSDLHPRIGFGRVHERGGVEDPPSLPKPVSLGNNKELVRDVVARCCRSKNREARELAELLGRSHLRALLDIHDEIGEVLNDTTTKTTSKTRGNESNLSDPNGEMTGGEAIRIVGLLKKPGQPLGLTVEVDENKNLTVARILEGGVIDKQGLLSVGDVILEVNGVEVCTPEDLQTEIARAKDSVTLKVGQVDLTSNALTHAPLTVANGHAGKNGITKRLTCYMRALFEYIPEEDTLLPCKEIGLRFDRGDILQIVDQKDPNWWQAKIVEGAGDGRVGLIPSLELEERRKAFVAPESDYVHKISICGARISKKKKKIIYKSKSSSDFDKAELLLYEEVTRMPPFKRKTLVLIGTQGVGKRTIKNRLINSDSSKFAGVVPYTTRPQRVLEENGQTYWFTTREDMEEDIRKHKFLEYGEYNGNLYGTHLDSIRDIIKQGKMCVLDCSPQALKMLHNSAEFLPYVIFIAAPGMEHLKTLYDVGRSNSNLRYSSRNLTFDRQSSIRYSSRRARTLESLASLYEEEDLKRTLEDSASMQRTYDKYIDLVIVNKDFDSTFRELIEALESLTTEHQWVPCYADFIDDFQLCKTCVLSDEASPQKTKDTRDKVASELITNGGKTFANVGIQCGDSLTCDEENIVVMVKSFSPLRTLDLDFRAQDDAIIPCTNTSDGVAENEAVQVRTVDLKGTIFTKFPNINISN